MGSTLFLHIGCGKTGSSALQNWLARNARPLNRHGIRYPLGVAHRAHRLWLRGQGVASEYAITSGNGAEFVKAIKEGRGDHFLRSGLRRGRRNALFSSEMFQSLDDEQLAELRRLAERRGYSVAIIAYVRDVYDIVYSAYLQQVKRHLCTRSFRDFALGVKRPQQFAVLERFERHFDDIHLLHYDTEKPVGIENAFKRVLGLGEADLPAMSANTVNRSLSVFEAELMRAANRAYTDAFAERNDNFSRTLSDALIYADPERTTEVLVDQEVIDAFAQRFGERVRAVNQRYFGDDRLQVFRERGKAIVNESVASDPAIGTLLTALVQSIDGFSLGRSARQSSPAATESAELAVDDPRIVNTLRDAALAREGSAPREAFLFMATAQVLRPGGAFIAKKMAEYGQRFRVSERVRARMRRMSR